MRVRQVRVGVLPRQRLPRMSDARLRPIGGQPFGPAISWLDPSESVRPLGVRLPVRYLVLDERGRVVEALLASLAPEPRALLDAHDPGRRHPLPFPPEGGPKTVT